MIYIGILDTGKHACGYTDVREQGVDRENQ
jgi:hypothetical protein